MPSLSAQLRHTLLTAVKRDPVKASRSAGITLTDLRGWLDGGGALTNDALGKLANFAGYEMVASGTGWQLKPLK
jgi:hypothetical protein